jgi:nucleoside-diphosphate-sugar epimerase
VKILITGATGFIGKHLVNFLLPKGIKIVIITRKNSKLEFPLNVESYCFNYDDVEKDIKFLEEAKIDGVVHLASLFLTEHKTKDLKQLIESNLFFSTYLLECSAKAGIKWFINTGTFWQNYQNAKYSPVNLYAATKEAFQKIAQYYIETEQICFSTIKLCDTYGPNDIRPKILNLFKKIAKTGETLNMSPGEQIINMSYIDDIMEAYYQLLLLLSSNKIKNGSIFAVKAPERFTLKELARKFEEVAGLKLNINWGGRNYRNREVMIPWENGIIIPGWEPKVFIEAGIKKILSKR